MPFEQHPSFLKVYSKSELMAYEKRRKKIKNEKFKVLNIHISSSL